ncbi:TetR family transcriptional regulator [Rhizobium cremeum]|uniref:TetR/AcrR family transcriptional regulator n=1 Tax=Rhizobium cremeum TaxID=2813827 RepID=UPI001FCF8777|nr:TetR/AcrR family transcriptional regulator [Rhizobium cremeum]MCJ7996558.1 TetR family transcriptional regulator [Rhizobium cremeum]MCJ8001817.1 TetR family transcriptional regulator [Rhizobium cremeum]
MTGSAPPAAKERQPRRMRRPAGQTREDILNTAEELFRTRGYANAAIVDIAHALGMSPANVFKHFHSKASLVDAIAARHMETKYKGLASLDDNHPACERLLALARHLMASHRRDLEENPYIFEMILLTAKDDLRCGHRYRDIVRAALETIIVDGCRKGEFAPQDSTRAAEAAFYALACVLHPIMIANEKPDILATRCEEVVRLINAALQTALDK